MSIKKSVAISVTCASLFLSGCFFTAIYDNNEYLLLTQLDTQMARAFKACGTDDFSSEWEEVQFRIFETSNFVGFLPRNDDMAEGVDALWESVDRMATDVKAGELTEFVCEERIGLMRSGLRELRVISAQKNRDSVL